MMFFDEDKIEYGDIVGSLDENGVCSICNAYSLKCRECGICKIEPVTCVECGRVPVAGEEIVCRYTEDEMVHICERCM